MSLLVWSVIADSVTSKVYCSRVSRDLELLDAPGVLLGNAGQNDAPLVTWDGTYFWVIWPEQWTYRGLVQLVSPEPVGGSILLEESPFIIPGLPISSFSGLVARPGGPVLFAMSPYFSGAMRTMLLNVREVKTELPMLAELPREAVMSDRPLTPTFLFAE